MGESRTLRVDHFQHRVGVGRNHFDAVDNDGVVKTAGVLAIEIGVLRIYAPDGADRYFGTGGQDICRRSDRLLSRAAAESGFGAAGATVVTVVGTGATGRGGAASGGPNRID